MSLTAWIGVFLIVGAAGLAWWAVAGVRIEAGLVRRNLGSGAGRIDVRAMELSRSTHERVVAPMGSGFARRARRLTPKGWSEATLRRLQLAGVADRWPVERMLAMKLLATTVGIVLGALVVVSNPSLASVVWAAAFGALGWFAPEQWLSRKGRFRQAEIERSLPDVLDQVTISVEAGLGFESAIARAAVTGNGPLADELGRTMSEIRAGVPRDAAFDQLLDRTHAPDLRHFVLASQQAHRHGIPIAKVLRVQATELRDKRRQRAEEAAQKVPVKVIVPLICCILPALFVVVLGPAVIRIKDTF
jgi:tight adherence protein C